MTTKTSYQQLRRGVAQVPYRRNVPLSVLGGVCAGLGVRLGVRPQVVRVLFSLACLAWGVGLIAYVVLWLGVPRDREDTTIARRIEHKGSSRVTVLWNITVVLALLLALSRLNLYFLSPYLWSLLLSGAGLVAVWSGTSADERAHLEAVVQSAPVLGAASAKGWRAVTLRVVPATVLMIVGVELVSRVGGFLNDAVPAVIGVMVLILGLLILLAPWWLQNVRDLATERRQRIRGEERAALVAHVHDSVLQTLTLIERAADRPQDVVRLARAQERALRAWLFAPDLIGVATADDGSFTQQLHRVQHDIEDQYGVTVELVVVGDCDNDQGVADLLAATREAATNAATWSGADRISLYGEVEDGRLSVFVRDTGRGFDPALVSPDRQGITHSIVERMALHGGAATVRSAPGGGTEVALTLPRHPVAS